MATINAAIFLMAVVVLLAVERVKGYNNATSMFNCDENLCLSKNYDLSKPPYYPQGLSTVNFAMMSQSSAVKKVDDHSMMILFEPEIVLAWGDPRIAVPTLTDGDHFYLPDSTMDQIWTPKITVLNCAKRSQQPYRDPGKYSKVLQTLDD